MLLIFTFLRLTIMSPYNRWVHTSFKEILLSYCNEFLESSDRVPDKTRLQLVTKVSNEIADIAKELMDASLPEDLEKVIPIFNINVKDIDLYVQCVRTWFGNYASANSKEGKAAKDTHSHPTSSKAWTARLVCGHIHVDRISEEHKALSDNGEKDIGKYRAALANVFEALSEGELKECENFAIKWIMKDLPDEIQRK